MSKKFIQNLLAGCIVLTLVLASTGTFAAENVSRGRNQTPRKVMDNDLYRWFLINNLFNYYSNTGDGSINPNTGQSGFEFPKGSKKFCTFEDGVVWGGFHKGRKTEDANGDSVFTPKVGGSTYSRGLQAGVILTPGGPAENDVPVADDPELDKYRVYMVRPDVTPTTSFSSVQTKLEADAALISRYSAISAQALFDIFVKDWNEWPAKDGLPAPYKDVNGDGHYDPAVDIPGQPGADQTLYYVANDCNNTTVQDLYGSPTIGLEMHRTIWGYNQSGALGNTVFESTLLINKSGAPLDSTFLVQWSDVDNGDANDDYTGCDVPRGLGYTYNGKAVDQTYGVQVPAVGYTFFQGPILSTGNQGDSAVFRLQVRHGYKNMGMTTFVFFINSSTTYSDPDFGTGGDIQWYYLMNGLISGTGAPFINPITNQPVKFTLDGDPVTGTGWIDGTHGLIPGDRRQCSVTGPFTLANGDTQEVVVAHVVGLGSDRISSVAVLKWYSDLAQTAYNLLFNIPFPPPSPKPAFAGLDGEIALNWPDSLASTKIETWNSQGYKFEGYNVYQFEGPSADFTQAVRVATYDLLNAVTTIFDDVYDASTGYVLKKPVEFGHDTGIRRTFETKTDAFTSLPLHNGTPYYFGVTSYSYKEGAIPTHLEGAPELLTIFPHAPNPGTVMRASYGQYVPVNHTVGISTAIPAVAIVDPSRLIPSDYEIQVVVTDSVFNNDLGVNVANPRWQLFDLTNNRVALPPSTSYDTASFDRSVIYGMKLSLIGAPFYTYGKELGASVWTGSDFNFTRVNVGSGGTVDFLSGKLGIFVGNDFFGGVLNPPDVSTSVEFEFTDKAHGQNAYDFLRGAATGSAGAPYLGYFPQPFKVWELNADGSRRRQLDFAIMEAYNSTYYDSVWAPGASSGDREYWFVIAETYSPTEKAKYVGSILGDAIGADSVVWGGWQTLTDPGAPAYVSGDDWKLLATNIVTAQDRWRFSTKSTASAYLADAAKVDVSKINVFPNPYIGFNPLERDKYNRFVTFSHLPTKATIRIFNLAGVLVRTLMKDDATSQFQNWDLRNESGFPVAAGMYIVYIDMPEVGATKTLKMGVIPEQQYIDRW